MSLWSYSWPVLLTVGFLLSQFVLAGMYANSKDPFKSKCLIIMGIVCCLMVLIVVVAAGPVPG